MNNRNKRGQFKKNRKGLIIAGIILGITTVMYAISPVEAIEGDLQLGCAEFATPVPCDDQYGIKDVDMSVKEFTKPAPHAWEQNKTVTESEPIKEIETNLDYAVLIQDISMLESTGGLYGVAKTCKKKGMYNDWGYHKGGDRAFCFDTYEEGHATVNRWLIQHLEDEQMTLAEALCHYNQGTVSEDCTYYQDRYLNLKGE